MKNSNHKASDNDSKPDIEVYIRKIDHLKSMLEMTQDIARIREDVIKRLEHELKDMAREKFIFLN